VQTGRAVQAVLDQQRQLAVFTGRPLGEQTLEELLISSSPTETDGKDPLSADTDPVYD